MAGASKVSDADHVVVLEKIVLVAKVGTIQLLLVTSCHSSPLTVPFNTTAARDAFFNAIVSALPA